MAKPLPRSPLAEMQALMARAVMRPLASGDQMQRTWDDGSRATEVAAGLVMPNDRLSSFDRLQIYNQQYWWRLRSAFAEDFRGLRAVLGERRFDRLALAYLDHCGSKSWTLRDLGSRLESFLRERPELAAPHTALALDMVQVEWARVIAFDGPEEPPIVSEKLRGVPPARLRLGLQPHLSLLELGHPIDELLRRLKRQTSIETGAASNAVASIRPRARRRLAARASDEPIHLAVHRVDFSVYFKRIEAPAWRLLRALRSGATLEAACEKAFAGSADAPEQAAVKLRQWFSEWMNFGWFTIPRNPTPSS